MAESQATDYGIIHNYMGTIYSELSIVRRGSESIAVAVSPTVMAEKGYSFARKENFTPEDSRLAVKSFLEDKFGVAPARSALKHIQE